MELILDRYPHGVNTGAGQLTEFTVDMQNVYILAGQEENMVNLLLIAGVVLFALWALGLITSYTLGGGIHILLVIGVILVVVWLISGRRR